MITAVAPASTPTPVPAAVPAPIPAPVPTVPFMSTALTQADIDAVNSVLKSGMLRAAKRCDELEQRWAAMTEAKHAMTCANGTCALQLAYEPLFQCGDEVLVPAWSYIATVSMVVARGGIPVFVEALEDTFQIDPSDAARKVTSKTRAIAATHLYGCPADIDAIQALAKASNLKVIYDAAQSHLATYKGKPIGNFGDAVTYSMYATKNLATGEGGLITCNDDALARQIKLLRSHGETDKYLHEQVGYNYRMNDMAGAIGCSRLDRLPSQTAIRQSVATRYDAIVSTIPGLTPPTITPGATSAWHLYTIKLDLPHFTCSRDEFCKALMALGVPTAVHYPRGLTQQPALSRFVKNDTPIADRMSSIVFSLPMHHDLTDAHIAQVESALRATAAKFKR